MGEAQGGHVLVLEGKLLKVLNDLGQLGEDEVQGTLLEDQVGVVGDWRCVRRRLTQQASTQGLWSRVLQETPRRDSP